MLVEGFCRNYVEGKDELLFSHRYNVTVKTGCKDVKSIPNIVIPRGGMRRRREDNIKMRTQKEWGISARNGDK